MVPTAPSFKKNSEEKIHLESHDNIEILDENEDGYAIIRISEGKWESYGPEGELVLDGSKIPPINTFWLKLVKDDGKVTRFRTVILTCSMTLKANK